MERREFKHLVESVCAAYSLEEFHELVDQLEDVGLADLNIDKELRTQVWQLIRKLHQHGPQQLLAFVRLAAEQRPHQPALQSLLVRLTGDASPENLADGKNNGALQTSMRVDQVVKAVEIVEDWRRHPLIRPYIETYSEEVATISRQIILLAEYKKLHDILHRLQFAYPRLEKSARSLSEPQPDSETVQEIDGLLLNISEEIETARSVAQGLRRLSARGDELAWIVKIYEIVGVVRGALELPRNTPTQALEKLKRLLRQEPERINELLVDTAKKLPLTRLLDLLRKAGSAPIPGLPLQQIYEAHTALQELERDLQEHINVHKLWQTLDRELWQAHMFIGRDLIEEFLAHWRRIKSQVWQLTQRDPSADWVFNLEQSAEKIDQAFAGASIPAAVDSLGSVRLRFGGFRREAVTQFFKIDLALKDKCDMISEIGQPLRKLLVETGRAN